MDSLLQKVSQGEHVEVKAEIFENEQPGFENVVVCAESRATDSHIKDNLNENTDSLLVLQNINNGELAKVKPEMFGNDQSQFGSVDYTNFLETAALHVNEEIVDEKYFECKYSRFQSIDYGNENTDIGLQNVNKGMQFNVKEAKFDLEKAHCVYNTDSKLEVREKQCMGLDSELRTIKQEVRVDENSLENYDPFVEQSNKLFVFENTDLNCQDEENLDAVKSYKTMGILYPKHERKDQDERTMGCHVQDKTYLEHVKYHPNVVNNEFTNPQRRDVLTTSIKSSSGAGNSLFKSCKVDVDSRIDLPHHCHECGKVFKTAVFLGQHMAKHSIKCYLCGKAFKTEDKQKRHMTTHGIVRSHLCYVCGKEFESASLRTKHTCRPATSHSAELPYQCSVCQKGFKTMFNLKTHRFRHTAALAHQCVVCGEEQKTEREYRVHMLYSHSTERHPHECTLCRKDFRTRSDLGRHMLSHSAEWPYHCYVCDRRFKEITSLQQHLSCHHMNKTSICFVCGTGFHSIRELRDHANAHSF